MTDKKWLNYPQFMAHNLVPRAFAQEIFICVLTKISILPSHALKAFGNVQLNNAQTLP